MSEPRHLIRTSGETVRKRVPESEIDEQRKNWNLNDSRLTERRTLEHQVLKKN